ncbi:Ribokinase-like protein [Mycena rosella]|uniref:Ribokinase-like protein n=1 Tax=Mycena rosella TaxID=1033263 RepID=A0AAD7GXU8_MYCRO|nr:Ribokinase-like protein [Mycena rosella]
MAKLRRENPDAVALVPGRPLRIVASGTLFLTHTLSLPSHPAPSTVVRAHSVTKSRGGSASTLLSLLAQFSRVEAFLVAPLGGNDEGKMILRDLQREGVITRYCKIWKGAGVPSAWVLESAESNTRTVVNHNPLPDITHEEFVSILGPLLAPENYMFLASPTPSPTLTAAPPPLARSPNSGPQPNPNSPAPFDWLHFEGRSVKTTLSNITGLDGLARERKWRSHCVFSVDVGRSKGRQGVEALIPYADVLFLNKHYAQANSPNFATSPRSFLLSLTSIAPPHALLVAHWGSDGAAVLSLPTKEYFQSSGWVEERPKVPPTPTRGRHSDNKHRKDAPASGEPGDHLSVRTGSDFWAGRQSDYASSSAFTATQEMSEGNTDTRRSSPSYSRSQSHRGPGDPLHGRRRQRLAGTEVPEEDDTVVDEVGAQDAFVAGMIYALSRRITPGAPYTPSSAGEDSGANSHDDRGRWRLDECLRFATELSGRKARRRNWDGLGAEMTRAGWFDN